MGGEGSRASHEANSRDTTSRDTARRDARRPSGADGLLGRAHRSGRPSPTRRRPPHGPPRRPRHRRAPGPPGRRRPRHAGHGHHLHRLLRRPGHRPGLAVRRHPPGHRRHRVAPHRGRPDPAAGRPQPLHRRPLQRPARRAPTACSRPTCWPTPPTSGPSAGACAPRSACGPTSAAATWCATPTAPSTCWRTTCGCRPGVSYLLENRAGVQAGLRRPVRPPEHPARRRLPRPAAASCCRRWRPTGVADPTVARAHARRSTTRPTSSTASWPTGWASPLVEGRDLFVDDDDRVYMRTIGGPAAGATSSTGGSTTCSSIPRCSTPTRRSACRG